MTLLSIRNRIVQQGADYPLSLALGNRAKYIDPEATTFDLRMGRDLNHVIQTEHFAGGDVAPVAGTVGDLFTPGGFRLFGEGLAEAADSGMVHTAGLDGQRMSTTNEIAHTIALGTPVFLQPDLHGPFRFSALLKVPVITAQTLFLGFTGAAAAALAPRVTGATTVLTLVDDDLAGLYYDAGLGDADRFYVPHNKSNAAPTLATTAAGVDTGKNIVAAKLTLVSVDVDQDGNVEWSLFDDAGSATGEIASALDADEQLAALLYIEAIDAVIHNVDVMAVELDYYHQR